MKLRDTNNATFSRGSADSGSDSNGQDGIDQSGRAGFHVPILASQEGAQVLTENDLVCGGIGCGLFGHVDPFGCSLRTYLLSEVEARTPYSVRWKKSVTPAGRSWWVLMLSGHRCEKLGEFGSWLRPCARDWKGYTTRAGESICNQLKSIYGGSGVPNPTWIEWVMGYPAGWTDLEGSETP